MSEELKGLQSLGLLETFKNIGVYVVDVETTGLRRSDHMFSAAYTQMDINNSSPLNTKESFFNIKSVKRPNATNFKTPTDLIDEYEQRLAKAHSSDVFGKLQLEGGSLREAATAMAEKTTVTPATFLNEFSNELSQQQNGSIVLSHNSQFENNQFENLKGSNQKYNDAYLKLKAANIDNRGLFGASSELSSWSSNTDAQGLSQRIRTAYESYATSVKGNSDPTLVRKALGEYANENKNLINYMSNQIKGIEGQAGKYTNIDTMPVLRALMSFGALNGDVDPKNLMLGGKVADQAMAWFGEKETHTASGDTRLQGRVANVLFEELEEYAKDPNYRSTRLKEFSDYITENNVGTKTFKDSITSEISNTSKYKTKADYIAGVYDWIDKSVERYSIASGDHSERVAIANQVKGKFDSLIQDNPARAKEYYSKELENWMSDMPSTTAIQQKGSKHIDQIVSQSKSFLKTHKNKLAVAGVALAGSLFLDGSQKGEDKKYNTFDEVYNSQYYGSGFADWQERNNAHKVLY